MTDFNTLLQEVYNITNRPDLVTQTQLAVKSATLQLHRSEFFYKDIFETALKFNKSDFIQTIDYRSLFSGYRALKYLRKYDPLASTVDGGVGKFFEIKTPTEILDPYGLQVSDICYVAGSVIQVKSSTAIQYGLIGVYLNPVVSPENYKSWIADEAMYAIVYKAASIIFGTILGDIARMNANDAQAQLEFTEVRNSNIIAEGY